MFRINGELRAKLLSKPDPSKAEAIQCAADIMLDFVTKVAQNPGETAGAYRDRLIATVKFSTDVALGKQKAMLAQANAALADDVK